MDAQARLWHVTVTVTGDRQDLGEVRSALSRLLRERPFINSVRYDPHRAELRYWEESADMVDAASLALRVWNEHRSTAELPDWKVVGLEVIDQETYKSRGLATPVRTADAVPERF